ncbi:tetratricopeptide repeat protein [Alistipes timonensis]
MGRSILFLSILYLLTSCGQNGFIEGELLRANGLMRSQPDSALYIIENINSENISRRSTRARYALLYSQALDKNGIDLISDSLIRPAINYFQNHGRNIDKAKAWYYLARIYDNQGDLDNAIKSYIEAERFMVGTRARRLLAMLYANIGNLYTMQYSFDEALFMYEKALEVYRPLQTVNEAYVLQAKASTQSILGQYDEALETLAQAKKVALVHMDTICLLNIAQSTAATIMEMDDNLLSAKDAKSIIFDACREYNKGVIPGDMLPILSDCYFKLNQLDSAKCHALKALDYSEEDQDHRSLGLYALLARICEAKADYSTANDYLQRRIVLADSLNESDKLNLVQDLEQKYHTKQVEQSYKRLRNQHIAISIFASLIIIILGGVAWIIHRRRKALRDEYLGFADLIKGDHLSLQKKYAELEHLHGREDEKSRRLFAALDNRLQSLQKILELASTYEGNADVFYEKVRKHLKIEGNKSGKALDDLFDITNLYYNDIIFYLQAHYPKLNQDDLALCCMVCLGFSPQQTRLIFNHTNSYSIYTKRSKLRSKLGLTDVDNLEDFFAEHIKKLKYKS